MRKNSENIDLLLEKHTNDELAKVDWELLNNDISQKLERAGRDSTAAIGYKYFVRVAAVIAIAGLVMTCMMLFKSDVQYENNPPEVTVTFTKTHGSAKVEIIKSDENENEGNKQPSMIIIRKEQLEIANIEISRDELDFACLL